MTVHHDLTRRAAITIGTAGAAAGALALAGCADVSGDGSDDGAGSSPAAPDDSSSAEPPAAGEEVAATADVPVGGSIDAKLGADPVLVAQPTQGEFVAFSAICTHQQCVVAAAGAEFHCPCHGSIYDAATGEVLSGPAPEPLSPIKVVVAGDQVVTAS